MKDEVKILIAGDYCPINRIEKFVSEGNYEDVFNDFVPLIRNADLSIVNLECVATSIDKGVVKIGPKLKVAPKALDILKNTGFDMVTLANNHIMDFGKRGLVDTIEQLKRKEINHVGAGMNLKEANQTKFVEIKGFVLAIINISENEFSTTLGEDAGAHPLDVINNYRSIEDANLKADFVIVIVHGGHEMYQLPSPRMKDTYRFFAEAGASIIVNHHQHCYSGFEEYKGVPIFYGIGNFIFDGVGAKGSKHLNRIWNEGYCIDINFSERGLHYQLVPYIQNLDEPGVKQMKSGDLESFEKNLFRLNKIIADDIQLKKNFENFCKQKEYLYSSYLEPYSIKPLRALKKLKILPSLFSKRKRLLHLNLVRCESHRDVLLSVLKNVSK